MSGFVSWPATRRRHDVAARTRAASAMGTGNVVALTTLPVSVEQSSSTSSRANLQDSPGTRATRIRRQTAVPTPVRPGRHNIDANSL